MRAIVRLAVLAFAVGVAVRGFFEVRPLLPRKTLRWSKGRTRPPAGLSTVRPAGGPRPTTAEKRIRPPPESTRPAQKQRPRATSAAPITTKYDLDVVLAKSILFYEAQRSGKLPHSRKVTWRGDSGLLDRGTYGEDLVGGWYDAGDHMKFGFTMAASTTILLWGLINFRDAYEAAGLLDDMFDCVKWPLEYFLKAHTLKYEFYAQVGDPYLDHNFWGRAEDMNMSRPAFKLTKNNPGSDVVAETAAAMAAGAIAFNQTDRHYSRLLLKHAAELFDFAVRYPGKYSDSLPIVKKFYPSSDYSDELAWAGAWLYKASGQRGYLDVAERNYHGGWYWSFSWDEKEIGTMVLLYNITGHPRYRWDLIHIMRYWLPGGKIPYTPKGLAYRSEWGVLRYAGNMALIALMTADIGINATGYRLWAKEQLYYMLGDGGRSYVVGFGENPPERPHHAGSSCRPSPWPCSWGDYEKAEPNSAVLHGALVGGPGLRDQFVDDRTDFEHNEVTCDYNAGFQSAVAGKTFTGACNERKEFV